jgi:hypothetical protein
MALFLSKVKEFHCLVTFQHVSSLGVIGERIRQKFFDFSRRGSDTGEPGRGRSGKIAGFERPQPIIWPFSV